MRQVIDERFKHERQLPVVGRSNFACQSLMHDRQSRLLSNLTRWSCLLSQQRRKPIRMAEQLCVELPRRDRITTLISKRKLYSRVNWKHGSKTEHHRRD